MRRSAFVGIAILVAIGAFAFRFFFKPHHDQDQNQTLRLFTVEELALYNGTGEKLPILLGILGFFAAESGQINQSTGGDDPCFCRLYIMKLHESSFALNFRHSVTLDKSSVFDVTKGKSHYGIGGAYNHFAGRDASRAFVSGNFTGDGLTDSLHGLSSSEVKSVVDWRDFYFRTYKFVGRLVGRYYDDQGSPSKYLKGAEAKAARGAQLLEKQKHEEEKVQSCNSKWSQNEGGEVWCDIGYPRLMQRPLEIALTGKMSKRCVCLKEEELEQPGLELYEGCDYLAKSCRV